MNDSITMENIHKQVSVFSIYFLYISSSILQKATTKKLKLEYELQWLTTYCFTKSKQYRVQFP